MEETGVETAHSLFRYGPELRGRRGLLLGLFVVVAEVFYLTIGWWLGLMVAVYVGWFLLRAAVWLLAL